MVRFRVWGLCALLALAHAAPAQGQSGIHAPLAKGHTLLYWAAGLEHDGAGNDRNASAFYCTNLGSESALVGIDFYAGNSTVPETDLFDLAPGATLGRSTQPIVVINSAVSLGLPDLPSGMARVWTTAPKPQVICTASLWVRPHETIAYPASLALTPAGKQKLKLRGEELSAGDPATRIDSRLEGWTPLYATSGVQGDPGGEDTTATVFYCTNFSTRDAASLRIEFFDTPGALDGAGSFEVAPGETLVVGTADVAVVGNESVVAGVGEGGSARILMQGKARNVACNATIYSRPFESQPSLYKLPLTPLARTKLKAGK